LLVNWKYVGRLFTFKRPGGKRISDSLNAGNREEANEAVWNNIIDVQEFSLYEIILLMLKNLHPVPRINKLSPRSARRFTLYLKVK